MKIKGLIRQGFSFFGISGIGWLIDFTVFTIFALIIGINEVIINIVSSVIAVTFVYTVSTKKIFKNRENSLNLKRKYYIYVFYQMIVILLASLAIGYLSDYLIGVNIKYISDFSEMTAKIIITPFTMVTNFIFMKILIEKI